MNVHSPNDWRDRFAALDSLDEFASVQEKAWRGRELEKVFFSMLDEANLEPRTSYRPTGEEVDGSFWFEGRTILLEAKWTKNPQPASSLYQFRGKVDGKLIGTVGFFVSMSGFSADAVDALVAGKDLSVILADGDDIRAIAERRYSIDDALRLKLRAAGEVGTPYFALDEKTSTGTNPIVPHVIFVEGRSDVTVLDAIVRRYPTLHHAEIIPSGGPFNMEPLIRAYSNLSADARFTAVLDEDGGGRLPDFDGLRHDLGIQIEVIRLKPNLESVVGLPSDRETTWRRRTLKSGDTSLIDAALATSDLVQRAEDDLDLARLLTSLGVR